MVGGRPVRVGGMCKGSGMIHPNMATMLSVLTCDAPVTPEVGPPPPPLSGVVVSFVQWGEGGEACRCCRSLLCGLALPNLLPCV